MFEKYVVWNKNPLTATSASGERKVKLMLLGFKHKPYDFSDNFI